MGSDEAQRSILEQIESGVEASAEDIKATLLDDRPTLALAIFPVEQYTGTITTDLFAEDETSYFDDAEQFMALQKEAVAAAGEAPRGKRRVGGSDARTGAFREWQYRKARKNQKGGVLINLAPSGRVEIREGLVRPQDREGNRQGDCGEPGRPGEGQGGLFQVRCAATSPITRRQPSRKSFSPARARRRK